MVKTYRTISYSTWESFKRDVTRDICGESFFPRGKYAFRGQGVESWKLISSFDRAYGMMGFEERKKAEEYLLFKFKKLCIDWKEMKQLENYSIDQIRAIGQHFNLPTRLLDWSYSIYIAAFFAFSDTRESQDDVAIWALDMSHEAWNAYDVKIQTDRIQENYRQLHQQGIFTYNNSMYLTLEDYLEHLYSQRGKTGEALYKILLPITERSNVMYDIDMMGINYTYVYMDMEACAKEAILKEALYRERGE